MILTKQKKTEGKSHRRSVAEMYEVQPYYRRFNQKFNMTRLPLWHPEWKERAKAWKAIDERLYANGKPGYTPLDYAFLRGSMGNSNNTGFSVNAPNVRGNSWQPLVKAGSLERVRMSPREASKVLRKVGRFYGADVVGLAHLDRRWVYSDYYDEETGQDYPIKFTDEPGYEHYTEPGLAEDRALVIPKEVQYAVVMLFEMDQAAVATAPTKVQNTATRTEYSRIAMTTVMVAEFLRGLGYHAIPSANCTALNIPLAIEAGLGQLGRNAKLITPKFGPRCRIAKVLTDFPLEVGSPRDFGVTDFCNVCKKCARKCPPQCIPYGERSFEPVNDANNAGVLQWQVDHYKCREYWGQVATNCGVCLRVCPFNKGHHWIHGVTRFFIEHARWMDRLIVRMDDITGFGKYQRPEVFWGVKAASPSKNHPEDDGRVPAP